MNEVFCSKAAGGEKSSAQLNEQRISRTVWTEVEISLNQFGLLTGGTGEITEL